MAIDPRNQLRISRLPYRERIAASAQETMNNFINTAPAFERQISPIDARNADVTSAYFGGSYRALMFGSNNYLALSGDPRVKEAAVQAIEKYGVSMTGSMILNGSSPLHKKLEQAVAGLKGAEDAIIFSSGYLANSSWVRALVRREDAVVFDERGHTSFLEGLRLVTAELKIPFAHNDLDSFRRSMETARQAKGDIYVFTEGLFSMDGDLPPLSEMMAICREAGAIVAVDDAHGTGVLGATGSGIAEHVGLEDDLDITVGTLSKALGCVGGFICGSTELITCMRSQAMPNIFTASLPPPIVGACLKSIEILQQEPERIEQLAANSRFARDVLGDRYAVVPGEGPIIPIQFGAQSDVQHFAFRLLEEGIFVNCATFPAVPVNAPRLRITINCAHSQDDILALRDTLDRVINTVPRVASN